MLIGVRAVLDLVNSSNDLIQGNYLHHDYHGGFSQGYNLWLEGSSGNELAEHNVIRGGSWPIQSFGGEFRYNLVIDSGHDFWRSAADHTQIHHNVFAHASGLNTGYDGGLKVYGGESGLDIYNNTFDLAGAIGGFNAPAFNIGSGSLFQSIRNNLFTAFIDVSSHVRRRVRVVGWRGRQPARRRAPTTTAGSIRWRRTRRGTCRASSSNPPGTARRAGESAAVRTGRGSLSDVGGVHLAGQLHHRAGALALSRHLHARPPAARSSTPAVRPTERARSSARSA